MDAAQARFADVYKAAQEEPRTFWEAAAREISWFKLWDKTFDPYSGHYGRWFVGGETNTAFNCLDRHVAAGRLQRDPTTSRFFLSEILELNDARYQVSREQLIQRLVWKYPHSTEGYIYCSNLDDWLPF